MIGRPQLLQLTLRVGGAVIVAAFAATLLPLDWMAATHEWLGLGTFPRAPLTEYLIRSISLLYGFHGILMLIVSKDPVRFRPIVSYLVIMDIAFGLAIIAIDVHVGMPWWWTAGESGSILLLGAILAVLNS